MTARVFVDGAAGTTGLEILDRLQRHGSFTVHSLDDDRRKDVGARAEAMSDADFVVLCLPDEAAREAVSLIGDDGPRVVDASSAHRVAPEFAYGFPELSPSYRDAVVGARRVSNPGCYPTGFLALVRPLVAAGIVPTAWPVSVNAVSGYSGGGKAMIAEFEGASATAHRAYALALGHKHLPEMRVHGGLDHAPIFTPAVTRTYRGMLVEVPLPLGLMPGAPHLDDLRHALGNAYSNSAILRVVDAAPSSIDIERLAGSDRVDLFVLGDAAAGQARLVAALDNLGKGAAGATVQNLNIMAGIEETAGLRL